MAGFITERLLLCPYTEADLDDLVSLCSDPLVRPLVIHDEVGPRGPKFRERLRLSMERATFAAIIRLKSTGEFMGQAMVTITNTKNFLEGSFAICLLPKFWDNGYGTEATHYMVDYSFRWLDLQRISLMVLSSNLRAIAVYQKIGFRIEGRKRRFWWMSGRWDDIFLMSILYEEWAARELQWTFSADAIHHHTHPCSLCWPIFQPHYCLYSQHLQ
ncbi:acyl-CoA N-acyltransferase [Pisolithus marmoratus]|nr:acyl-CoA N-acyltransferase [Pisolithus marmoratus]